MAIKKATFKHIESELYSYQETKKEIQHLRESIINFTGVEDQNDTKGKNSVRTINRPTEQIATRLVQDKQLRNAEEIVDAIDTVYDRCSEDHKRLIQIKYWGRESYNWDQLSLKLNTHRNTLMKHRKEVVEAIAKHIGWR